MFSDDAFNKNIHNDAPTGGAGTLIGNWAEERVLKEASGHGRTIPQRHVPRSGLLEDFTKVPFETRKGDDTFNRVYGPKSDHIAQPASRTIGQPDRHEGKIMGQGPKDRTMHAGRYEVAEAEVLAEEEEIAKQAHVRRWETTTGLVHSKPSELEAEKAIHSRKSYKDEILHGPAPERTRNIDNQGLEFPTHAHYSCVEPVTHARMALDDPRMRSDVRASAASGVNTFGKNSEFTKPLLEFNRGLAKDEELETMYNGLQSSQPLRHIGGHQPRGPFEVPSLATLKTQIHSKIAEVWGAYGYVMLRQRLFDVGNTEGFVHKDDIVTILRDELGLDNQEVTDIALQVYLGQLATMKKTDVRIGAFLASLRPVITQKQKRRVMEAFKGLNPTNGEIRLGDWLAHLQDEDLRATVVTAFGAQDESQVAGTAVTEPVFSELLADLAPFLDVEALLAV